MTKRCLIGFAVGLSAFMSIHVISAHLKSYCRFLAVFERDACAEDVALAGWPLTFNERGGLDYRLEFDQLALFMDLAIGIIAAVICG